MPKKITKKERKATRAEELKVKRWYCPDCGLRLNGSFCVAYPKYCDFGFAGG